jgi:hypothetical protein
MRTAVRITSEHAGDPADPQDPRWKLVFIGIVESERLVNQFCYGFSIEVEGEVKQQWPLVLEPPTTDHRGFLYFGPGADPQRESINIFERDIIVGELFTRDNDSTYRITKVENFE